MQASVTEDRNKYIGGSDIPIIMGISKFKSRFDLLLEKAELKDNPFTGNEFTEYGNKMEPKIRQYINKTLGKDFREGKHIDGDVRCHTDGETFESILEIKTTSDVHENVDDYKVYLVQLLFYMNHTKRDTGVLAVYRRPSDFSTRFNQNNLQVFAISKDNYKDLIEEIERAVEQFRQDLIKVKENPFLTEQDLMPMDIQSATDKVLALEEQSRSFKELEKKYDQAKAELKSAMERANIKTWRTINDVLITLVADTPDKEVEEEYYDEEKFIAENTELHEKYHNKLAEYKEIKKVLKKGKKGYLKITLPKEES